MTDYKMTDEKRKKLTEKLLGECWHEWEWISGGGLVCKHCSIDLYGNNNLFYNKVMGKPDHCTFATDTDMMAVFRKIRDKGKWSEFYRFTGKHWLKDDDAWEREEPLEVWLFMGSYERACCLAADFLEEQG